ncbi:LOW QUALITY PROTEIN: E3 ubiquitin-protein ligase TRIM35-like [Alosa sapidissima]|uniref:LOW QUALITY PROTEIN: E3 ubiquitin-protein ligase TRIM35-like n=1 Tax=Alosa sapidissima TaxID=34773 RepID=UPI001C09C76C|nr:LOW QUALITY PROTEIN: E3 ubiquitin-protein ligase TRIM35-like [Alosa sapidissima]
MTENMKENNHGIQEAGHHVKFSLSVLKHEENSDDKSCQTGRQTPFQGVKMAEKQQVFQKDLCCYICSETFKDPVSLHCNHSFCQTCLSKFWGKAKNKNCPVCNRKSSMEDPLINFSLKELVDSFTGRLKLDKNPDEGKEVVCSKHTRTPIWFCVDEDRAVCDDCQNPTQHATHTVIPLEEAVQDMKGKLKSDLEKMQKSLKKYTDTEKVHKDMVQHTKSQLAATERSIKEVFEQLHQFLREEEEARLTALREEEEQKGEMIGMREIKTLQEQIQTLKDSIQHVDNDLKQDSVPFLKGYQGTKSRAQCTLRDPPLLSGALIDVAQHLGNLKYRVCEKMVESVEYYPVILDASTANRYHFLSDDLTSVKNMDTKHQLPGNPERFMKYNDVLGSEGFTSGKHCWEVQVGDRRKWTLGVAKETVERKGETSLGPSYGFWTVKKSSDKYKAGSKTLSLETKPQRVRVQLDYERGEVSFYDPSDMSHIYTYKDTFKDKLFPYFGTGSDDTSEESLQICPFKVSLKVKNL